MKFSSQKFTLAHIDESYFFRQGLKLSIRESKIFDLKISEQSIDILLKKLKTHKVDFVLLGDFEIDSQLTEEVLKTILDLYPSISIIAFQSTTNVDLINRMIKMGIRSFIPKTTAEDAFFETLSKVKLDGFYFDKEITKDLIDSVQNEQKLNDLNLTFSGIEKQILKYVSQGFTAEEISAKINKSKKTIEGYRYRMLKKANVKNIAELVAWAFRNKILK